MPGCNFGVGRVTDFLDRLNVGYFLGRLNDGISGGVVAWSSWIWVSSFLASWRMILRSYSFRRTGDLGIYWRKCSSFLSLWSSGDCFTLNRSSAVVWFGGLGSPFILASPACPSAMIISSILDILAALFLFRVSFRLVTMLTAERWVDVGLTDRSW